MSRVYAFASSGLDVSSFSDLSAEDNFSQKVKPNLPDLTHCLLSYAKTAHIKLNYYNRKVLSLQPFRTSVRRRC